MDISEHRATFEGFGAWTVWGCALGVMSLALLVCAFALPLGWFVGVIAWLVLGVVLGLAMNMGAVWWATLAVSTVLLGVGGGIVALIAPLMA
jgi:hypothetical protein